MGLGSFWQHLIRHTYIEFPFYQEYHIRTHNISVYSESGFGAFKVDGDDDEDT
jgi:hypothetical protein